MMLVIETNIAINVDGSVGDFQSRVIEIESWGSYIEEIKENKQIIRNAHIGTSFGCSLPRVCKVSNIIHDEFHLSCDVELYNGMKTKKLSYLVR